ncbi:MAG: CDP-alcohol phosphatidyltransferase family protein [Eggerthellaceae bacterium]|nr:CDP-alcohol phosphatidyltransferase family protein [Eggerthellaceae bacterium]
MANALTICRIMLSFLLLVPPALSPAFLGLYAVAGATDMLDGFIARKTGTESELGARLDSIADFTLAVVCLVKILPAVSVPLWLWIWIAIIVLVKLANIASGYMMQKRLVMLHTAANKAAGLVVFLVPFAIPLTGGITIPAIPACVVATFAAIQEGHFIRTGNA